MKTLSTLLLLAVIFLAGCQVIPPRYDIKAHFGECPINGKLCSICQKAKQEPRNRAPARVGQGADQKGQAEGVNALSGNTEGGEAEGGEAVKTDQSPKVMDQNPKAVDQSPKTLDQAPKAKAMDQSPKAMTQKPKAMDPAPLSVQEPVWNRIQRSGKVVVGVKTDTPPFSVRNEDGSFWGFEVDLMNALALKMGLKVEFVPVNPKQRIPDLLQDKVDLVMATMTLTKKREGLVDFSTPYFQVGQGLITAGNSKIGGFQDLDGQKVAVLEGTQAFHTLGRIQPGCQLVIVSSYEEGLERVISGEVSALCSDHLILMGLFHNHPTPEKLSLVEQTFAPDSYGIAMRENESSLRDAVNSAIMSTWEDGTWPDAFDTWFGPGSMYSHETKFSVQLIPE